MPVKIPDIAKSCAGGWSMYLIKIVNLLRYIFRYLAATFFIANEPASGMPRSVSVKIIDPVFERFFFNKHGVEKRGGCFYLSFGGSTFLSQDDPVNAAHSISLKVSDGAGNKTPSSSLALQRRLS